MQAAPEPRADFYVYVLFRHDTAEPFYVGKGCGDRWGDHGRNKRAETNRYKMAIIARAKAAGAEIPRIKFSENLTERAAFDLERLLIAAIGRASVGGPLANLTDGGEGECGRICSDEARARMRAAKVGLPLTTEHRDNIRKTMQLPDIKNKISVAIKAAFLSPEVRERCGLANRGRKRSPETAAKQKANNKGHTGHTHSESARQKMSAALKGKPWSERRRLAQINRNASAV